MISRIVGRGALLVWVIVCGAGAPASAADKPKAGGSPESSGATLDLRAGYHDFLQAAQQKQWELEDKWIAAERAFSDGLRKQQRELEKSLNDGMSSADGDWRRLRAEAREKRRRAEAEIRQEAKIRREQLELELMRFEKDREADLKRFLDSLHGRLEEFKKDPNARRAEQDLRAAGDELKEQFRRWRDKLKALEKSRDAGD